MVRNFHPSRTDIPRPTIPRPTYRNTYTPGQSAYTANRNSYTPDQNASTQRQSQNADTQGLSQYSYSPSNGNFTTSVAASSHPNHRHRDRDLSLDDQIAPAATSHSVEALQRFAQATSTIPAFSPRKNEAQIVDRIEARYGAGTGDGLSRYGRGFEERKRGRDEARDDKVEASGARTGKRRKFVDEVIDLTKDDDEGNWGAEYDYAQSSEWSWPGNEEEGGRRKAWQMRE